MAERQKDAWRAFWTEADTKLGVTAPSAVTTLLREHSEPGGACWRRGQQCTWRFLEKKVRPGKVSQRPVRQRDRGSVSACCLFWESEIPY